MLTHPILDQLRHQTSVEDSDWRTSRGLDRTLFQKLAMGG